MDEVSIAGPGPGGCQHPGDLRRSGRAVPQGYRQSQSSPEIAVQPGHEVIGAAPATPGDARSPVLLHTRLPDGSVRAFRAQRVINASWWSRARLDAQFAGHLQNTAPDVPSTFRLKVFLRIRLAAALRGTPSCMFIHGPYCAFCNLGDGRALIDYAPVSNLDAVPEIPESWNPVFAGRLPFLDNGELAAKILQGAEGFIPGISQSDLLKIVPGVLYNPGAADIYDPSGVDDFGVRSG